MGKEVFLTTEGYKALEEELAELKSVKRKEVAEKIKIAREFGDISENAEYDAAKEEQAMVEGKIIEIEQKLRTATIIEETKGSSVVRVGSTVKVYDKEFKEEVDYKIVGTTEANPAKNWISNESPVGAALIGKKTKDVVLVNTPNGVIEIQILKIKNA